MSQVLSQDEVDALLRGVTDGEVETESDDGGGEDSEIVAYDLTSQERIIRGRMPTLDIINQRFSRLFRQSLSTSLRKIADVSTVSTDTVKFGEFIKSLPVPASLHIFRMEPLRGFALFVAESKLVFSMVDAFFGGGQGRTIKIEGRDFTSIEQKMIKKVVIAALADWEKAWKPVHSVNISFVRSEVNPQFAAIVPPTDVVVVILFEIEMENVSGTITICLPYSTIEPIISKLRAGFQSDQLEVDQTWIRRLSERLCETNVNLLVNLGSTTIHGKELMSLKIGDVIQLDNDINTSLMVNVEGVAKFAGMIGNSRGNKAIKITEIIEKRTS